ncbi:hypothetical protein E2C01_061804 [Portunus trituberculatus]|uniref:Uncharacterized protein n=1 Tax=Portunus trituberculatus TaxID=210409 RepID=A0A5B7HEA4_PORTR|nr:hypothetical protein [Portunus trituberculatus]
MHLTAQGKPDAVIILDVTVHPTLPVYQEGEDVATYLTRFERVALLLQLEPSTYAVRLGCLLMGKAADLYVSLSPETTNDYDALKKSLLTGFKKTAVGYRLDFRNAKIRDGGKLFPVFSSFNPSISELVRGFRSSGKLPFPKEVHDTRPVLGFAES